MVVNMIANGERMIIASCFRDYNKVRLFGVFAREN